MENKQPLTTSVRTFAFSSDKPELEENEEFLLQYWKGQMAFCCVCPFLLADFLIAYLLFFHLFVSLVYSQLYLYLTVITG